MVVNYFTSRIPGDRNHHNRHAVVDGVEFVAFPYQEYNSTKVGAGRIHAEVSQMSGALGGHWVVRVRESFETGRSRFVSFGQFDERDHAFTWAAAQINGSLSLPDAIIRARETRDMWADREPNDVWVAVGTNWYVHLDTDADGVEATLHPLVDGWPKVDESYRI